MGAQSKSKPTAAYWLRDAAACFSKSNSRRNPFPMLTIPPRSTFCRRHHRVNRFPPSSRCLLILFTASPSERRKRNDNKISSCVKRYYFKSIFMRASCLHGRRSCACTHTTLCKSFNFWNSFIMNPFPVVEHWKSCKLSIDWAFSLFGGSTVARWELIWRRDFNWGTTWTCEARLKPFAAIKRPRKRELDQ